MKKIVSLFLIFILSLNVCAFAQTEDYSYPLDMKNLLMAIDIDTDSYIYNEQVTRGEFANLMFKASIGSHINYVSANMNFYDVAPDSDYYSSVAYLFDRGIVLGTQEHLFEPSANVTRHQALVMAVRTLRYPSKVSNEHFHTIVADQNLGKGVEATDEQAITYKDAFHLIYNMLKADMSLTYGENITYMQAKFKISEGEGILEDNGIINTIGLSDCGEGKVIISGIEYICEVNTEGLLGKTVSFYYVTDEDEYIIKSILPKGNFNEEKIIYSEDIVDFTGGKYIYYTDKVSETEDEIDYPLGAVLVYNGFPVSASVSFDESKLKPANGYVKLLDNDRDGKYEYVFIYDFVNDAFVNKTQDGIRLENGKDISEKNSEIFCYNANGEKISVDDFIINDVLAVARSVGDEIVTVIKHKDAKIEKISSIDTEDDVITTYEGGNYKISPSLVKDEEIKLGNIYVLYFDMFNNVACVRLSSSGDDYIMGYLLKDRLTPDHRHREQYRVRIYTETNKLNEYILAEKVNVFAGDALESSRYKKELVFRAIGEYEGIIRFLLNKDSEISAIEIPLKFGIACDDETRFKILAQTYPTPDKSDTDYALKNLYNYSKYRYTSGGLGGLTVTSIETRVWHKLETADEEEMFNIGSTTTTPTGEMMINADSVNIFTSYGFSNKTKLAKLLLISKPNLPFENRCLAVSDIKQYYDNEENEIRYKITGLKNSYEKTYIADKNVIEQIEDAFGNKVSSVSKGDILRVAIYSDEITDAKIIFDASRTMTGFSKRGFLAGVTTSNYNTSGTGNPFALSTTGIAENAHWQITGMRYFMGMCYSFEDSIYCITNQNLEKNEFISNPDVITDGYINEYYIFNNATTITLKGTSKATVKKGDEADVKSFIKYGNNCSRIIKVINGGQMVETFIINVE